MKESLTQLLVHLDASPLAAQRLEVARRIAQSQRAAVTALYAVTPALMVVPFAPEAGSSVATT
jgi:nucleotide-binding universal stress UspA family protein